MSNPIYGGTTTTPIPFTKTDQTFNPESANAQSGKAVAEALSSIAHVAPAITINNRVLQTLTVNDCSPVEHDLKVKVEVLDVPPDNMLTTPYTVSYENDNGMTYISNGTSISISGEATSTPQGVAINGNFDFSTLEHGRTYYLGLIYVNGDSSTNPLSFGFYCSGGTSEGQYGVSSIVWDSGWKNNYFVCMGGTGIIYDCEVIPVLSTAPIGNGTSGGIELSDVSITLTGANAETKTVKANADGTVEGLKSSYPDFTLSTESEGIIIDCTYKADTKTYIDKKIEELKEQLTYSVSALNTELASLTDVDE